MLKIKISQIFVVESCFLLITCLNIKEIEKRFSNTFVKLTDVAKLLVRLTWVVPTFFYFLKSSVFEKSFSF